MAAEITRYLLRNMSADLRTKLDDLKKRTREGVYISEEERKKIMALYLDEMFNLYKKYEIEHSRYRPSQTQFVTEYLGFKANNYSGWLNQQRLPKDENADTLANKLTLDVYLISGIAPRLPKGKLWDVLYDKAALLPDAKIRQVVEIIENAAAEEEDKARKTPNHSAVEAG